MTVRPTLLLLALGCTRTPVPRGELPDSQFGSERADVEIAVRDEAGEPVVGAWVTLVPLGRDTLSDADGSAVLAGVGDGDFEVHVAAPGFVGVTVPFSVPPEGGALDVALAAADTSAHLGGRVVDPYGSPVRDVVVEVDGEDLARTDPDGGYLVDGLEPGPHAVRFVPTSARLGGWSVPEVVLVEAGAVTLDVALPGRPTDHATWVGSEACLFCHGGGSEPGGGWYDSPHARATQPVSAWEGTGLAAAFEDGDVIDLGPAVPGGTVALEESGGAWFATVSDGATSIADRPVIEVYGGHRSGAALAVDVGGTAVLLPAVWALAGQGLSSRQEVEGFVPAYTEGWFDGGTLRAAPTSAASFDLQCAGCHATGHGLEQVSGRWNLVALSPRSDVERRIGCEACHGPGSEHAARPDIARLTIWQPGRAAPADRLETCARCHERVQADDHPFSADPGWPVDSDGRSLRPDVHVADFASPSPTWWAAVPASRTFADQVGELRASPHRQGPDGYDGACEDCHDPHGTDRPAELRRDPWNNDLCVTCHASRFPTVAAQREHAAHSEFAPGPWGAGTCTGCHMARSGLDVRRDAVSTVGELHSHALVSFDPQDILVEFDLAGEDHLPAGDVPVIGCLDCHLQVDAERREHDDVCACALGDPLYRVTYENLDVLIDDLWGTP